MRKTLTGVPCKTGIAWSFDAANGEFLWAKQTTEQNIVARIDGKGLVTVNEDVVLKDVGKTYRICPTYARRPRLADGRLQSETNVMFMPLSNMLHRRDVAHRSRGRAAVRLQHEQCRPLLDRQGQGRPHRCDLGRDRPHRVELGDARRRTTRRCLPPAAGSSSTARWTAICGRSMPTTAG